MTSTAALPARHAIGDHVIVGGYCRGCDRDTEEIGVIVGLDRGPATPAILMADGCYVIEVGGLKYHGQVTRVVIPADAKLHPADRWIAPFCEWCGRSAESHEASEIDYHMCREFYRDTGRPAGPDDDLGAYRAPF